jgi:hypothetical protein
VDRLTAVRSLTVTVAGLLLMAGCRDHPKPAGHSRVFVGHVRLGGVGRFRSPPLRACLRRFAELRPTRRTRVVARDGLLGASLTIADPRSPLLYGCDFTPGHRKLCGSAVGAWRSGRLNDPRLDILCTNPARRPLAAAWVVPVPRARRIAVRERHSTEVYPVAGGLPVRIWTRDGVHYQRSSAVFDVTQRAADGRTLAHEQLHAAVAG